MAAYFRETIGKQVIQTVMEGDDELVRPEELDAIEQQVAHIIRHGGGLVGEDEIIAEMAISFRLIVIARMAFLMGCRMLI
jgi:hypothetical protein